MLDQFTISSKNADIAFLESENMIDLAISSSDIYAFTEAVDESGKEGIGSKIVKKIKDLADKIIKFFQDFYNSAKAKILGNKIKEDPKALENKKAEVLDTKKLLAFRKKYKARIEKAKSIEEVDAIVAEYDKKNKQIIAGSVAGFVAVVPLAVLGKQIASGKLKEAGDKLINDLRNEADVASANYDTAMNSSADDDVMDSMITKSVKAEKNIARKTRKNENGQLVAKKGYALQKLISDDMKSVKDWFTSSIKAVSDGFKNSVNNAKARQTAKKAGKGVQSEVESMGYVVNKKGKRKGQIDVEASQAAAPSMESAEDSYFGTDDSFYEEAFAEASFFGEEFDVEDYEESFSDVKKKVSEVIQGIIEKIKKLYQEIKNKLEVAKIKSILKLKGASSTMKIKFAINDKNVTKTTKAYISAYEKYVTACKKIELQFTSGKITYGEFDKKTDDITALHDREIARIDNLSTTMKANAVMDEHEARQVREYLSGLTNYEMKVMDTLQSNVDKELSRLKKEAEEAERIRLANRSTGEKIKDGLVYAGGKTKDGLVSAKHKLASMYASANKKTIKKIIAVIALTPLVMKFQNIIMTKAFDKALGESYDDALDGIVGDYFSESEDDDFSTEFVI